jgi:hypothetical protein
MARSHSLREEHAIASHHLQEKQRLLQSTIAEIAPMPNEYYLSTCHYLTVESPSASLTVYQLNAKNEYKPS